MYISCSISCVFFLITWRTREDFVKHNPRESLRHVTMLMQKTDLFTSKSRMFKTNYRTAHVGQETGFHGSTDKEGGPGRVKTVPCSSEASGYRHISSSQTGSLGTLGRTLISVVIGV